MSPVVLCDLRLLACAELNPALLVLDPFIRLHRADENASSSSALFAGFPSPRLHTSNGSRPGSVLPKSPQALLDMDKNSAGLYPYLRCGDGPAVGIFPGQARELTGAKREVRYPIAGVIAAVR